MQLVLGMPPELPDAIIEAFVPIGGRVPWLEARIARVCAEYAALGVKIKPSEVAFALDAAARIGKGGKRMRIVFALDGTRAWIARAPSPIPRPLLLIHLPQPEPLPPRRTKRWAHYALRLRWTKRFGVPPRAVPVFSADGIICDAMWGNLALWLDGRWRTPAFGMLPGIARGALIRAEVLVEDEIPISALARAEGAALINSGRGVAPAASLNGRPLANPGIGRLQRAWEQACAAGC